MPLYYLCISMISLLKESLLCHDSPIGRQGPAEWINTVRSRRDEARDVAQL